MTQAAAYEFSIRTVQEWDRGAERPSGPARTLLRAIKSDPEGDWGLMDFGYIGGGLLVVGGPRSAR